MHKSLFLFLCLVSPSLTYRDGARNDSCYEHEITHLSFGQPVSKLDCSGSCRYDLDLMSMVNETNPQEVIAINPGDTLLKCGSTYIFSLSPATDIGLLIQARDSTETLDLNSTIWGTWIAPTEERPRYKTLLCKRNQTTSNETLFENSVTHTDVFDEVGALTLRWKAPTLEEIRDISGTEELPRIKFFYTIVTGLNTNYNPLSTPTYNITCAFMEETSTTTEGTSTTEEGTSTTEEGTSTTEEGTSTIIEGTLSTVEGSSNTTEETTTTKTIGTGGGTIPVSMVTLVGTLAIVSWLSCEK